VQVFGPDVEVAGEHARKALGQVGDERLGADDLGARDLRPAEVVRRRGGSRRRAVELDGMAVARLLTPLVDPERAVFERLETG
jgi:hypothetical protein